MKKISSAFVYVGLGVAFLTVSGLLIVMKKRPGLIKAKLRLGAMILTLTGAMTTSCIPTTCYVPMPTDLIGIENAGYDEEQGIRVITINQGDNVNAHTLGATGSTITYKVSDLSSNEIAAGDVVFVDGEYDSPNEDIRIVTSALSAGEYVLSIFSDAKKMETFTLVITD